MKRNIAALILAAGGSARMGRPKQLLAWRGTTLLARIAREALASRVSTVAVVIGSEPESSRRALDGLPLSVIANDRWADGLATSIAAGVRFLSVGTSPPDSIVILLADQPMVGTSSIDRLIAAHETTGSPLVACRHGSEIGVPALFASRFFGELLSLEGDHGARRILRAHASEAAVLDLPEAAFDVDTPSDYDRLLTRD